MLTSSMIESTTLDSPPTRPFNGWLILLAAIFIAGASFVVPTFIAQHETKIQLDQANARELSRLYAAAAAAGLEFGAKTDAAGAIRSFLSARSLLEQYGIQAPALSNEEAQAAAQYLCVTNGLLHYSPTKKL
jgi:hypothetical protein